ncbi:MAG: DUF1848 domain-containing protein [Candidatus Riflebacteria bacterium]|nr:DUF1848 domain-containing protein [Candidatus Riflebacteria bacterium]
MRILSVSRRTDIPRFYCDWFLQKVRDRCVEYNNPFNRKVIKANLTSDEFRVIVFWTRDPSELSDNIAFLQNEGFFPYFHVTMTNYGFPLEQNPPEISKVVQAFRKLAEIVGPACIVWRYDPIILSACLTEEWHVKNFSTLAQTLSGTVGCCYISFVDLYSKTLRNLKKFEIVAVEPDIIAKTRLAERLNETAARFNIPVFTCCEDELSTIPKGHCIDAPHLAKLSGEPSISKARKSPTRKQCGCWHAVDIGTYNTCHGGCIYCYATTNHNLS